MGEIYRDDIGETSVLSIAGATVTAVKFVRDGADVATAAPASLVTIPYAITYTDGEFDIVWTYTVGSDSYIRTDRNEVVTPYFTQEELIEYNASASTLSVSAVTRLEKLVRKVIDRYTNQNFGLKEGYVTAYGRGNGIIEVSSRVNTISTMAYAELPLEVFPETFRPINGGFALTVTDYADPYFTIKVPAWEEEQFSGVPMNRTFGQGIGYLIGGTFGWQSVPEDVKMAALMLSNTYTSDETVWAGHYVKAISAADWSLEFASGLFSGTGDATVDSLLDKYIRNRISII